jgi:hypothetical protein
MSMDIRHVVGVVVLGLLVAAAAETPSSLPRAQSQTPRAGVEEELLGEVGAGTRVNIRDGRPTIAFAVSLDGRRVAWTEKHGNLSVLVNGQPLGPAFEDVLSAPMWSLDGAHVAYQAKRAGKVVAVRDGEVVGGTYEQITGLDFSFDGRLVWVGWRNKECMLVVDGQEGPAAFRDVSRPLLGPGGKRIALAVRTQDGWQMVVDSVAGPVHAVIGGVPWTKWTKSGWLLPYRLPWASFSADGTRFSYVARPPEWTLVIDGKVEASSALVSPAIFSPDGKRYAYVTVAQGDRKRLGRVVVDGKAGPIFEEREIQGASMSDVQWPISHGGVLGYEVRGDLNWGGVTWPHFSRDGQHVVYAGRRSKTATDIMLDGTPVPGLGLEAVVAGPSFGPNGQVVALGWVKDKGKARIVEIVDGKSVRSFPSEAGMNFAESGTFSPDGSRVAYVLGLGGVLYMENPSGGIRAQRRVVVDGVEGTTYNAYGLTDLSWSPDGKSLAYRVHGNSDGRSFVVLNGQEGPTYDQVLDWLLVDREGRAVYVVRAERRLLRVTQKPR